MLAWNRLGSGPGTAQCRPRGPASRARALAEVLFADRMLNLSSPTLIFVLCPNASASGIVDRSGMFMLSKSHLPAGPQRQAASAGQPSTVLSRDWRCGCAGAVGRSGRHWLRRCRTTNSGARLLRRLFRACGLWQAVRRFRRRLARVACRRALSGGQRVLRECRYGAQDSKCDDQRFHSWRSFIVC